MRSEWISVQIECHSPRGTEVHRGVFPASNVVSIQVSSISAVIAQVWEAVSLMEGGADHVNRHLPFLAHVRRVGRDGSRVAGKVQEETGS